MGDIGGLDIEITVVSARNLVAKDRSLVTRKKTSSDPYVKVYFGKEYYGSTRCIMKSLNPTWNQKFKICIPGKDAKRILKECEHDKKHDIMLWIFDQDDLTEDDNMGISYIPLDPFNQDKKEPRWYPIQNGAEGTPMFSKNATGEIQVMVNANIKKTLKVVKGNSKNMNGGTIDVCLQWALDHGLETDLDTSCVGVDSRGNILMDETVYFGDLINTNGSIRHTGDQVSGGKDEVITCNLDRIPRCVTALYFLLTIATPNRTLSDVKSASVEVTDKSSGYTICKFIPDLVGDSTAMFLFRIARDINGVGRWKMKVIDETDSIARDFGTLIPEIKGYSRDLVPDIKIDPTERIAVMRKGGAIRVADYTFEKSMPSKATFGLAWDVTNGVNIDLDASAICLDSALNLVDIVYYRKLRSDDNSIIHHGDEREGDEVGDDEKIDIYFDRVNPNVSHIAFVINSFSGQELDDVSKASCHLFDSSSNVDIARYALSDNHVVDGYTGLVMACLYREGEGWNMRIISEPAHGRVAQELVDEFQTFLLTNPPPAPLEVPEPDIVVTAMPEDVEIVVDPIDTGSQQVTKPFVPNANKVFVPP